VTTQTRAKQEIARWPSGSEVERTDWGQELRRTVARAEGHWFAALLGVIAAWQQPEETVHGRSYRYLIGGEAFDWLLLAERLCAELDGLVPREEIEALLFESRPPLPIVEEEFRRLIGPAKYRAHLNFFYGVLVEAALQMAVEEEIQKERLCQVWNNGQRTDDEVCQRVYGLTHLELLQRFCQERGTAPTDELSLGEYNEFIYWLFKHRLRFCEPVRVASDTRKGLAMLAGLESARQRRLAQKRPGDGWPR